MLFTPLPWWPPIGRTAGRAKSFDKWMGWRSHTEMGKRYALEVTVVKRLRLDSMWVYQGEKNSNIENNTRTKPC
jgi:hypothetical protein